MNKKLQILCLALIGTVFQANDAKAITNGDLYKACKSFAEAGFKIRTIDDTLCLAYTRGLIDMQRLLCLSTESINEQVANFWLKAFGTDGDAPMQIDAIIQAYVNHMASHPQEWKDNPNLQVMKTSRDLAPCK